MISNKDTPVSEQLLCCCLVRSNILPWYSVAPAAGVCSQPAMARQVTVYLHYDLGIYHHLAFNPLLLLSSTVATFHPGTVLPLLQVTWLSSESRRWKESISSSTTRDRASQGRFPWTTLRSVSSPLPSLSSLFFTAAGLDVYTQALA